MDRGACFRTHLKAKEAIQWPTLLFSTSETGSFIDPGARLAANKAQHPLGSAPVELGLQVHEEACPKFWHWFWGLELGSSHLQNKQSYTLSHLQPTLPA